MHHEYASVIMNMQGSEVKAFIVITFINIIYVWVKTEDFPIVNNDKFQGPVLLYWSMHILLTIDTESMHPSYE